MKSKEEIENLLNSLDIKHLAMIKGDAYDPLIRHTETGKQWIECLQWVLEDGDEE